MRQALAFISLLCLTSCVHAQTQGLAGSGGAGGLSGFQNSTLPPFAITTGSCPSGTLNQSGYTCQVTAQNGQPPYTCTLNSGTLPGGLQLVGCSVIGTPVAPAGVSSFQIKVTDSASTPNSATQNLSISVGCPSLSILTPSQIPAGQQGTAYGPFQFQANGGILPLTWSQNGGALCSGLSLDLGGLGQLSGTPTVQQTCNFGMQVADSCNLGAQTASGQFTQQINTNIAVTTTSLPGATAGVFYQRTLSASGGTPGPGYTWTLQTGSTLPATLTLSSGGTISGTVNVDGTYPFTVQAKDSLGATATQALSLTVSSAPIVFQTVSPLPSCTQGQTYPPFQMQASGGFGTLTYTAPGLASVGLAISTSGLITGSCSQVGTFTPTITITDQSQPTPQTFSQQFTISMKANIGPLVFNDLILQQATAGVPYSAGVTASGGVAPYTFTLTGGSFPTGLSMNSSGTVSGTATISGSFSPVIQVTDSQPTSTSATFSLNSVCPAITSTEPAALPPATLNTAYSAQVNASGGYGTLSHAATGLPSGLSISAGGLISGTPTATGAFSIVDTVTDQCSPTPQTFAINLTLQVNTALAITNQQTLPNGTVGTALSIPLTGSGGVPPYTWSSATLPGGLGISGSNITGTPDTPGNFTVSVTLTDSVPNSITGSFTITIFAANAQFDGPAQLPLATFPTALSTTPTPGTVTSVANGANLQTAITNANCGDVLKLAVGATYTGQFTLPNKACDAAHWIQIRSAAADTNLPAEGVRLTPCYAGVATLAGRPNFNCVSTAQQTAKITADSSGQTPITLASGANHYRLGPGLEITRQTAGNMVFNLVAATASADHIIFDRDWIHGTAQDEITRGILLNGVTFAGIIDSTFTDFHCAVAGSCADSQTISGGTSNLAQGTWSIINNFLESSTEGTLFGGATGTSIPTDITIQYNYYFKPLTWLPGQPGFVGKVDPTPSVCPNWDPAGGGQCPFVVKNQFELKTGQRVLFERNYMQNVWGNYTQHGFPIVLTPLGPASANVTDIVVRYNYSTGSSAGINIASRFVTTPPTFARLSIHDDLLDNINSSTYGNGETAGPIGSAFEIEGCASPCAQVNNILINHLTLLMQQPRLFSIIGAGATLPVLNATITNSIVSTKAGLVITSDVSGSPCAGTTNTAFFNSCFVNFTMNHNALIAGTSTTWPTGNFFPVNVAAVNFVSANNLAGGDYRLCKTSLGCASNSIFGAGQADQASDGSDLGADITGINTFIAIAKSGNRSGPQPLQFYVATTGSDTNTATQAQNPATPWASITHAAANLIVGSGGTVVNVASGTYNECPLTGQDTAHSGASNAIRVAFVSTVQYGAAITCTGQGGTKSIWINGTPAGVPPGAYIDINGFDITATGTNPCNGITNYGQFDHILNNRVHDIPALSNVCGSGVGGPGGAGILMAYDGNVYPNDAHDNQILNNIVDNVGFSNGACSDMHGIYLGTTRNIVYNNLESRACGFGLQMFHETLNEVVSDNVFMNNLQSGLLVSSSNGYINDHTSVINNIVVGNSLWGITEQFGSGTGANNVYRNNITAANGNTVGCSNPPAGTTLCPYNFTFGARTESSTLSNAGGLTSGQWNSGAGVFVSYTGNARTGDYHPVGSGFAISNGATGACATGGASPCVPITDFVGNPTQAPPYIGAYQTHP